MKFYSLLIKYRFWLGLVLLALAIFVNIEAGFWQSLILYIFAVIALASHFFIGPMRLIQEYVEAGDVEGAEKVFREMKASRRLDLRI